MSQQLNDDFNIDPLTTSGTELASILNRLNSAVLSMQSGTSRPSYAVQGFKWLDITADLNIEKFYTGSTDLSILEYDTTNNVAQINGGAGFTDKTKAIKHKTSSTALAIPLSTDMQAGEFFLNTADKKLYFKDSTGAVQSFVLGYTKAEADAKISSITAGFKNLIINGGFDIWQRGEDVTITAQSYVADRWEFTRGGADLQIRKSTRSITSAAKYQCEIVATSASVGHIMRTKLEDVSQIIDGEDYTIAFDVLYSSGITVANNTLKLYRVFDDGGTTPNQEIGSLTFDITTSRVRQKLTFTAPTSSFVYSTAGINSHILVEFTFTGGVTQNLLIGEIQLEKNSDATSFEQRPVGLESSLCRRYYWRGVLAGNGYGRRYGLSGSPYTTGSVLFQSEMRAVPTINTITAPTYENASGIGFIATKDGFEARVSVSSNGAYRAYEGIYEADAEL